MLKTTAGKIKIGWIWWAFAFLILAFACYAIAVKIVNSIDYHNNDFFTFWLAGHMVTVGGDPYSSQQWIAGHEEFGVTWIPNNAYVYPLPLSLLFAPLGLLSLKQAYIVWVAFSELMILAALVLLLFVGNGSTRLKYILIPLLVGTVFFRPTILTLFNGQISGWLLLLMAGVVYLWSKGQWEWGSLLLPLSMLKPNLGAPLIFLLGLWLLFQKRFKSILVILAGGLVLLSVGFLQDPHWVADYWGIGNTKLAQTFGGSPTVWGLAALTCPGHSTCALIPGSAAALLVVIGFLWLVLRSRAHLAPQTVVGLAVSVTLLVIPYTWTYDQLLLIIPITVVTLAMDRMGYGFPFTATIFLGIDFLVVVLLFFDVLMKVEILNAIVPIVVLGLCAWCQTRWIRKAARPGV